MKVQKYLDSTDDVVFMDEDFSNTRKSPAKVRTTNVKFRTPAGVIRRSMKPVSCHRITLVLVNYYWVIVFMPCFSVHVCAPKHC